MRISDLEIIEEMYHKIQMKNHDTREAAVQELRTPMQELESMFFQVMSVSKQKDMKKKFYQLKLITG